MSADGNWFAKNPGKAKVLVFLLCFAFIEGTTRLTVAMGVLPHTTYPTNRQPQFWASIDPVVGLWRYANTTFRDNRSCFDAVYRTNSLGARDPERTFRSADTNRVVVLGDSFTEGVGIPYGQRITDILESETGIEHLNFGTVAWGTIQQWLYYKHYAQSYEHSSVFILLFPENDFKDNHPDYQNHNLYRPYLKKSDDDYEVYYTVEFEERFTGDRRLFKVIKNMVDNNVYFLNVVRWAWRLAKDQSVTATTQTPNDYDDYTSEDLEVLKYALGQIADLTGDRTFYIITIPSIRDFEYAYTEGNRFRLIDELEAFAAERRNTHVIDLARSLVADARRHERQYVDYTFGCDYHWSTLGNRVAANAILRTVYSQE